jgi:diacylglycerol kinase (ATP)
MRQSKFSIVNRFKSFAHAFAGLKQFFETQHNAIVHAVATVVVIAAGIDFGISKIEWIAIALSIAIVWAAELLNSAIEVLCNLVMPEKNRQVKYIKDAAAAAVLISAIAAMIVGVVIFYLK